MVQRTQRSTSVSPGGLAPVRRPRLRPLAALALSTAAALAGAAALSARLVFLAPERAGGLVRVDQVIELGVLVAGATIAWWLAAGLAAATVCATARGLGGRWAAGERFVARHAPVVVGRALALAIGAGVGLASGVIPAGAEPADPPADLGWVATQAGDGGAGAQTPLSGASGAPQGAPPGAAHVAPPGAASVAPPGATGSVTVRPGDSLWAIAADHLPADASATDIAAEWPRWYESSRAVVGGDPDHIQPGQSLTAPPADSGGPS
ncbi:LysM peptidoglycan-binding domain-containing protein [Pengzhenrongella sp.]|jgi:hypothetical protein|uniref:LysM peptidoglycan-binding domain-containing protein n=1 Tax=Pengzhenrongella sp. TaxID=2888820 RepID=UPI002F9317CB